MSKRSISRKVHVTHISTMHPHSNVYVEHFTNFVSTILLGMTIYTTHLHPVAHPIVGKNCALLNIN